MDSSAASAPLDHVIFYSGTQLPHWAAFFEKLGFTVTPLGRHSSGSVNRLVVLRDCYLELIGFEPGTPPDVRPDVQARPQGLNGIAFRGEPKAHWPGWRAEAFGPTSNLERRVVADGIQGTARFRVTSLREPPAEVRVFLCEHLTPELVWHAPWQRHANGAAALPWLELSTAQPAALQQALGAAMGLPEAAPGAGCSPYRAGTTAIRIVAPPARATVAVSTTDLSGLSLRLAAEAIPYSRRPDGALQVPLPAPAETDLVFVAQAALAAA